MGSFPELMKQYREQLEEGDIQKAYQGLINYIMGLRSYFEKKYPSYSVSGSIYLGYMDMTYFSFFPKSLKTRRLKVGIVFVYSTFRFEVWLFGYNKTVQEQYWKLFRDTGWNKHHIPSTIKGSDSIVEGILAEDPDFSDLPALTQRIEERTLNFIDEVENFLSKHTGRG